MFESWRSASSGEKAGTYQPRGSLETMANLPVARLNEKMVYISSQLAMGMYMNYASLG
jgi:hypothetical protein